MKKKKEKKKEKKKKKERHMKIENSNLQVIWKLNYQEILAVVNL